MKSGLLFPNITNKKTRTTILKAILSIKYSIPSIKSLHENLKLVAAGAKVLKELVVGKNVHTSLRKALKECWTYSGTIYIEVRNGEYRPVENLPKEKAWKIVYLQLWVGAIRNFTDLGGRDFRQEPDRPTECRPNAKLQWEFVRFARMQGIQPRSTHLPSASDPRRVTLRSSLGQLYESLTPKSLDELVDQLLPQLPAKVSFESKKHFDSVRPRDDITRRCGVPYREDYNIGQHYLFLPNLAKAVPENSKDMPTVHFVQRDFINAFFGPELEIYNTEAAGSDKSWEDGSSGDSDAMSYEYENEESSIFDDSDALSQGSSMSELTDNTAHTFESEGLDSQEHSEVPPSIQSTQLIPLYESQRRWVAQHAVQFMTKRVTAIQTLCCPTHLSRPTSNSAPFQTAPLGVQ
jgi:hypothetical protein